MNAGQITFTIIGIIAVIALYWTPSLVAWRRHVPNLVSVVVLNALLGWTLLAWAVCLAWAVKDIPPLPAGRTQQYIP